MSENPKPKTQANKRGTARLHAVQALYQMDVARTPIHEVFANFSAFYLGKEVEGVEFLPADELFFKNIVNGVIREQSRIDPALQTILDDSWSLRRVDTVMRSILRAGAYEIFARLDIPVKVIITEYVDVTNAFLDAEETGMVNAVLDELATRVRPDEITVKS